MRQSSSPLALFLLVVREAVPCARPARAPKGLPGAGQPGYLTAVNWHQVIDERNYEMDQVVADVLRHEPAKLNLVVAWIEKWLADPDYSVHAKDALTEWLDLIRSRGLPGVLERLADRSEDAVRMRQSSPFAVLMPQDERQRILRKYEALRPRTHLASV